MSARSTEETPWTPRKGVLLLVALFGLPMLILISAITASAMSGQGFRMPYSAPKLKFDPAVVQERSQLQVGPGAVALRLVAPDGGVVGGEGYRVKVRFLRVVGMTNELGDDVEATWVPADSGGYYLAATRFGDDGLWRADVLAIGSGDQRGEAQTYFEVRPRS